jgi:hypothetical protein
VRRVALITGPPRSGKTSLAKKLAPAVERIHLDQVAIVAGIKHPDLLPPEINADEDLAVDLSLKIQRFTTHLARIGRLDVLLEEVEGLMRARKVVRVIEGECLPLLRDSLGVLLNVLGARTVEVDLGRDLGDDRDLLRHLYAQPLKQLL